MTTVHCWLDSSFALHWIGDRGEYGSLANRVRKIQSHPNVPRHVPSTDNPADLGSHGGSVIGAQLWWNGPTWLADLSQWPPEIVTEPSPERTAERKVQQELFAVGVEERNDFDILLEKFGHEDWCLDLVIPAQFSSPFQQGPGTSDNT